MTTMIPVYEITTEKDHEEYQFLTLTEAYTAMWNLMQYHESFKYMEREVRKDSKAHTKILSLQDNMIVRMMKQIMSLQEQDELEVVYTEEVEVPVVEKIQVENTIEKPIAVIEQTTSIPPVEKPRMQKMPVGKKKPAVVSSSVAPVVEKKDVVVEKSVVDEKKDVVVEKTDSVVEKTDSVVEKTDSVEEKKDIMALTEPTSTYVPSGKGCTTLMVRGPRKGQLCEAACPKGQTVCRLHAPKSVV